MRRPGSAKSRLWNEAAAEVDFPASGSVRGSDVVRTSVSYASFDDVTATCGVSDDVIAETSQINVRRMSDDR